MHELIEKIVVQAPDKSNGHSVQQIDIYYRFNIAVSTAVADRRKYEKIKTTRKTGGFDCVLAVITIMYLYGNNVMKPFQRHSAVFTFGCGGRI
ncbi:MAG: DUF4368 domain-containing protein [Oscillospiraceae bacterium]|nr:DUF4368 domain-containing protein [Oscillospiraceae bacterium]